MWVRGLKQAIDDALLDEGESHPMWVRGLKRSLQEQISYLIAVAPHVGAWIETSWKNRH